MEVRIFSIKEANKYLKNKKIDNIKAIIVSSCSEDIECIMEGNKIKLHFDDIVNKDANNAINLEATNQIVSFVEKIDFEKFVLYVCCDNGVSRSSAIAAAILRKYKKDDKVIWRDYMYSPNPLVYQTLCKAFGVKVSRLRLKILQYINKIALKIQISKSRKRRVFAILEKTNNIEESNKVNEI